MKFAVGRGTNVDTFTVNHDPAAGENGSLVWGNENPFNDVQVRGASVRIEQRRPGVRGQRQFQRRRPLEQHR